MHKLHLVNHYSQHTIHMVFEAPYSNLHEVHQVKMKAIIENHVDCIH
jgi:hypothetical protein